jgi:hypothetical protein
MKHKLALWTAVGLLVVGCAQQQASQGGASDFEPLPIRDTVSNDGTLPGMATKRSLGKPIPSSSGYIAPAEENSNSQGPELLRERKRYEAVPL